MRTCAIALAAWTVAATSTLAGGEERGPVVRVAQGEARGVSEDQVLAFKGLPYAAPPVGALRWRRPQPAANWTGVRDATRFGADCVQKRGGWDATQSKEPVSEDCLTLNVWTPAAKPAKAPVMVWIHGGGFTMGSGSQPIFDGAKLARRGVVVVSFNYRLGRFGFFAHPALTAEAGGEAVGNYGLMDQVAALTWVRRNIAAFGGDPSKVTIFGESAGGGSVNQLMLIGQARGLFRGAVAQSGGGRDDWPTLAKAEATGLAFAAKAKVTGEGAQALTALRALPPEAILGGLDLITPEPDTYSGPMIDGRLVTEVASAGFAAGRAAKVPYLVGANSNELGILPPPFLAPITAMAAARLGPDAAKVKAAYGTAANYDANFASDLTFVEPARALAVSAAAHDQPVYLYSFGYVPAAKVGRQSGAPHASDLAFVFGNLGSLDVKSGPEDERMSQLIGDYWTSFAKTGDPNGGGRPVWPRYQGQGGSRLVFGQTGAAAEKEQSAALDAIRDHFASAP